ncbi:hypothetical protein RHSIM_Rhsim01G0277400 [Rhododendron simsii]|uniref:Ubiquitin-like domain-containing protein n=1 Tax=Rhododendron simsii TaxID=118357 RepID=A0A834HDI8_RHOSS|nr:hypothetical protein RHSIM_Rhsim01G0277400 [Rhododendron simsii]
MDSTEDEMNVYLKVIKRVALKVKRSETTKKLKVLFHEKEGTPENLQELFFTGKQLQDEHKLVDYGIQTNSTLHLYLQAIDKIKMNVYLKVIKTVALKVKRSETTKRLKALFHEMEGTPGNLQELFFTAIERIKLLVNIPSNVKTIELEAKTTETVENIKLLIQTKEGILSEQFTLFHKGELLEDNRTLTSLGIQSESMLYLVLKPRDVVSVSVKMQSGEILKLKVKVLQTVQDLKAIVQSMVGFVAGVVDLTYAGKLLEDSKTLACCNIKENSLLEMLLLTFEIFVKDVIGRNYVLEVCKGDKVLDVKKKMSDKQGMPVSNIRLIFACEQLVNDRYLATYNVEKDSILFRLPSMAPLISLIQIQLCVADFAVKKRDRDGRLEELQACFSISGLAKLSA